MPLSMCAWCEDRAGLCIWPFQHRAAVPKIAFKTQVSPRRRTKYPWSLHECLAPHHRRIRRQDLDYPAALRCKAGQPIHTEDGPYPSLDWTLAPRTRSDETELRPEHTMRRVRCGKVSHLLSWLRGGETMKIELFINFDSEPLIFCE